MDGIEIHMRRREAQYRKPNAEAEVLEIMYAMPFIFDQGSEWSPGGVNNPPAVGYRLKVIKHPTRAGEILEYPFRDGETYNPRFKVGSIALVYIPLLHIP
jgi:hypothetical protein